MPESELDRKQYKKFLKDNLEKIVCSVTDSLICSRERHPHIMEALLLEAHAVLHSKRFNNHEPENQLAWHILSFPIRVAVDFEFQRIHLVALIFQQLSNHSLDEFILEVETSTMQRMVA